MPARLAAEQAVRLSQYAEYDAREWGWQLRPAARERVYAKRAVVRQREAELAAVEARVAPRRSPAGGSAA